jgi:hypothetical protein
MSIFHNLQSHHNMQMKNLNNQHMKGSGTKVQVINKSMQPHGIPVSTDKIQICVGMSYSVFANVNDDFKISLA